MLPVVRDDTETKKEAAQRISKVPTLTVQQHKRTRAWICHVFEACSSVRHQYGLNTIQRHGKIALSFSLGDDVQFAIPLRLFPTE